MNYDMRVKKGSPSQRGFIALMATILISLMLLTMVVEEGTSGWYARFTILGTETKEQANSLAEGCADQARAAVMSNPVFIGNVTITTPGGTCYIYPVQFNQPEIGLATIETRAQVQRSFTNLLLTVNLISGSTSLQEKP